VIVSLTGWGLLFYGGYKFFTKGKNDKKEEVLCSYLLIYNLCLLLTCGMILLIKSSVLIKHLSYEALNGAILNLLQWLLILY
jgi:hypothetical protein